MHNAGFSVNLITVDSYVSNSPSARYFPCVMSLSLYYSAEWEAQVREARCLTQVTQL